MSFEDYLNSAWEQHAKDPSVAVDGFEQGYFLLTEASHIPQFADLATHVFGEHLGLFAKGRIFIDRLKDHLLATDKERAELAVSTAILHVSESHSTFSLEPFGTSARVKILATAASVNAGLGKSVIAAELFVKAVQFSEGLHPTDAANRAMAIGSNNLASAFEEKPELSADEKKLMIEAAHQARKFWAIAGNWLHVERAEYRLARCHLKAGDILNSIKHANLCLTICEENNAPPLELFFAFEAIASVEKAMKQNLRSVSQMKKYFEMLSADDQVWCRKSLNKLLN